VSPSRWYEALPRFGALKPSTRLNTLRHPRTCRTKFVIQYTRVPKMTSATIVIGRVATMTQAM
jgi:hypothetical protein